MSCLVQVLVLFGPEIGLCETLLKKSPLKDFQVQNIPCTDSISKLCYGWCPIYGVCVMDNVLSLMPCVYVLANLNSKLFAIKFEAKLQCFWVMGHQTIEAGQLTNVEQTCRGRNVIVISFGTAYTCAQLL